MQGVTQGQSQSHREMQSQFEEGLVFEVSGGHWGGPRRDRREAQVKGGATQGIQEQAQGSNRRWQEVPRCQSGTQSADETPHDPEDYNYMLHFVHEFEDPEAELSVLKQEVKTWKPDWAYLVPDIYWSRWESALTFHYEDDEETPCKSNVGHFHFANNKPGLLVAIACSYLLAACR